MRKRVKVTTAIPVGSSDYNSLKTKREILSATHENRMAAINMMTFSAKPVQHKRPNYGRPYVKVWGKKSYIPMDRVDATEQCGIKVSWD